MSDTSHSSVTHDPAFLFDLDGTLIDSVYQHVIAWQRALADCGIELAVWKIHRRIGMSGGLFVRALLRELGRPLDPEMTAPGSDGCMQSISPRLPTRFAPCRARRNCCEPSPSLEVPWAIATSGHMESARHGLAMLGVLDGPAPIITRDLVRHAKPDPDLFLAAAEKLGVPIQSSWVVGDSIWDLLARAGRPRPQHRTALGRVRRRRVARGRRLPGLRRSGRHPPPSRRGRRPRT